MRPTAYMCLFSSLAIAAIVQGQSVTVCTEEEGPPRFNERDRYIAEQAELMASLMFHRIGVKVQWHRGLGSCPYSPNPPMYVKYDVNEPKDFDAGTLGWAMPFEGMHVNIYYNRIANAGKVEILAHLLVHELSHLMQGLATHADAGIMKAVWDHYDLHQMQLLPLQFTNTDVQMIHKGLEDRAQRIAAAQSSGGRASLMAIIH